VLLEQFIETANGMPDPRLVPPEDAADLLVNLIELARTVESEPDHQDRRWTCAKCHQIIDEEPTFAGERAYHDVHAPKNMAVGPPLGRLEVAAPPGE